MEKHKSQITEKILTKEENTTEGNTPKENHINPNNETLEKSTKEESLESTEEKASSIEDSLHTTNFYKESFTDIFRELEGSINRTNDNIIIYLDTSSTNRKKEIFSGLIFLEYFFCTLISFSLLYLVLCNSLFFYVHETIHGAIFSILIGSVLQNFLILVLKRREKKQVVERHSELTFEDVMLFLAVSMVLYLLQIYLFFVSFHSSTVFFTTSLLSLMYLLYSSFGETKRTLSTIIALFLNILVPIIFALQMFVIILSSSRASQNGATKVNVQ